MEEMEARVWQRVGGKPPMELPRLTQLCREAAADYRALAPAFPGEARQTLLALHREAAFAARALAGILTLRGLDLPPDPTLWPERNKRRALALAYRRSCTLWEAFSAWSASAEFAPTFRYLAQQETTISYRIAALIT